MTVVVPNGLLKSPVPPAASPVPNPPKPVDAVVVVPNPPKPPNPGALAVVVVAVPKPPNPNPEKNVSCGAPCIFVITTLKFKHLEELNKCFSFRTNLVFIACLCIDYIQIVKEMCLNQTYTSILSHSMRKPGGVGLVMGSGWT